MLQEYFNIVLAIARVDKSSGLFFESLMGMLLMQTNEALLQPGESPLSDSANSQSGSVQGKSQRGWIINDALTIVVISEHPNSNVCRYKYFY